MKSKFEESVKIPEGIECSVESKTLKCKKSGVELSREFNIPKVNLKISKDSIVFECNKGNKNQYKKIKASVAHIKNLLSGLSQKYTYKLQTANVHFPMTLKVEKDKLLINNFLGEKKSRSAVILPNVDVNVKGQEISVSSHNKEAAGQTAANIEKATKVRYRDRRIFQDGIYITEKPEKLAYGA